MMNCGKITSNLTLSQCGRFDVGITPEIIIFNRGELFSSTVQDGVVRAISLSNVAYRYETYQNGVEVSSTMNEGTYAARFTHEVAFQVFVKTQKIKRQLNAMANGRFVAIVKNVSNESEEVRYEVYGLDNGLIMTECEAVSNNAEGVVYSVVLASGKDAEENELPLSYWAGSVEATESGIASLLGLYIDVRVQGNGAAAVRFINQYSPLYKQVSAIAIDHTILPKEHFHTFNDGDWHTVRLFLSSAPSDFSVAFYNTHINSISFHNIADTRVLATRQIFHLCSLLENVDFENIYIASLGDYAFSGCTSLTSITIPDGVTTIGENAFSWCSSLTSITIPDSVTSIGENAFRYCSSLTSVSIGKNVTSIGAQAFYDVSGTLYIDSNYITSINYISWYDRPTTGNGWLSNAMFSKLIFGENIESIGNYTFVSLDTIKEIDFSGAVNLHTIGEDVFGASSITSLNIPRNVKSIGNIAFRNCTLLETLTFQDNSSLSKIGDSAFINSYKLNNVTIPDSVTFIGALAFRGCYSLENISFGNSITEIPFSSFSIHGNQIGQDVKAHINIGSNVKKIADYAFEGRSIDSLVIPANVETIEYRAFAATNISNLRFEGSTIAITGGGNLLGDIGTIYVPLEHISNYRNIPQLNGYNIVGY